MMRDAGIWVIAALLGVFPVMQGCTSLYTRQNHADGSIVPGKDGPVDQESLSTSNMFPQAKLTVRRFEQNPIIRPDMLPGADGENINGPSLIKVPDWIENPLGRYYLYFSHHGGKYIRMAYADRLEGPWRVYARGMLHLADLPVELNHIASPDVIIDEQNKQIRLYCHGYRPGAKRQDTFLAISGNGLDFDLNPNVLGMFYFRVFQWNDHWYALAKAGWLYESDDGLSFRERHNTFKSTASIETGEHARHLAVHLDGHTLWVYYSRIGDAPERIQRSRLDLRKDPSQWYAENPEEVLRPEMPYEGIDMPIITSKSGFTHGEHALRDPGIYTEGGKVYLLYSVAGESGIAIAEIRKQIE